MVKTLVTVIALAWAAAAGAETSVAIAYLRQEVDLPPVLSNLESVPADLGEAGAALGLEDNTTTGAFLGQDYTLAVSSVPVGGDMAAAARAALAATPLLIVDAPAATLLQIADLPEAAGALILNVAAAENALREADCRANVLHVLPTTGMRSDALMQFFTQRRWTRLALITGPNPDDIAYAEALKASAAKFGLSIVAEKPWDTAADLRRSAGAEVPLFTQDLPEHDALLIADEAHDFGRYVAYNTWSPRLVAGSEGLTAEAWSPQVEQWGAAQLQGRFRDMAERAMAPRDWAAWAAMRVIGEAVTRTGSADPGVLRDYMLGPEFELAAFKGRPLSFREWNGQLRQPIPLATERAVVAMAPLDGFLHQVNELDTLGRDRPETECTAFGG